MNRARDDVSNRGGPALQAEGAGRAWYREPWPWLLMSGPAAVVVAGIATLVIAVRTSDGVVSDDYYKQGLAINRVLARDARAGELGMAARVTFNDERSAVRVSLASRLAPPESLRMTLVHPTRARLDQSVTLALVAPGLYQGAIGVPHGTAWTVSLEDRAATWRITGRWLAAAPSLDLGAPR